MTAGVAHEPLQRLTSTETAQPEVVANNTANDEEDSIRQAATQPPVHARSESRDVSVGSRNTRDSLRRNVSLRSHTFTASERLFLEQLTIEGSDTDVERALQAVGDESLFFEHASPRHARHPDDEIGLDLNPSTSSGHDDATRDGEAASVATSERRGLDKVGSSLTSKTTSHRSSSSSNPVPATILGSQKRREVLERRRSDSSLNMATLWRAHETGLAVTSLGSQKSLLRRESSISSFGSSMSGLSVIFGNRPHPGASQEDVFRSEKKDSEPKGQPTTTTPSKGGKPPRTFSSPRILPPMPRRSPLHRRSKSATLFSPVRSNLPKIHETRKPTHARAKSFSKRRSVTFHHIDEELEFDQHLESMAITPVNAVDTIPKRSAMGKRHSSDSQITIPPELQLQRETSTSSIPSLHHGTPIRQDSITSIPSLHHGTQLRDSISIVGGQSVSSIPSLHQGTPLRSDSVSVLGGQSVSSIPSLHHATPLRSDSMSVMTNTATSVATFGSLRPANPLRQDSVASFPSLHPGNPIRQDSVATLPSINHARPIRQDSVAGSSVVPPSSLTQGEMIQQFGVTEDVAAAWLELAESKTTMDGTDEKRSSMISTVNLGEKRSSVISTVTLPDDVRVPDAATAPTVASTTDGGDIDPSTTKADDTDDGVSLLTPMSNREAITGLLGSRPRPPIVLRQASQNVYEGEGVEATELDDRPLEGALSEADSYYHDYQNAADQSGVFRTISLFQNNNYGSIRTAGSFDDVSMFSTYGQPAKASEVFRDIRRSLSDDNLSVMGGKEFLLQIPNATEVTEPFVDEMSDDGGSSGWEMEYASPANSRFDAWNILQDEYANGYGGAGTLGFQIFGTSAADELCQPHVLSPPLMESLQAFLPPTKSGENFYLKYSMIRDGASLPTLLKRARGIQYTILAVETIDGEVFGSFTGQAWRKSWNYFGTGESFLWKMRHSRLDPTNGILDQAQKESEIDVYPYTGDNDFIQLCTHDRIAVGGGIPEDPVAAEKKTQTEPSSNPLVDHEYDWGLGLALRSDLLQGSSSPCLTFGSPSLCKAQPDGERFEVMNVELWTLTPCSTEEEAEKLDLGKLFLGSALR